MTPNLLARTIETVEGGGLVILLMRSLSSLTSLCTMVMVRAASLLLGLRFQHHSILTLKKGLIFGSTCKSRMYMRDFVQNPILKLLGASMNDSYYQLLPANHVWLWMMSSIFYLFHLI